MNHYNGQTAAEMFADDLMARRALKRLDLPLPPQLKYDAIVGRYAYLNMQREDGRLAVVDFIDGSTAALDSRDRWVALI
jgi:hypothetical protein